MQIRHLSITNFYDTTKHWKQRHTSVGVLVLEILLFFSPWSPLQLQLGPLPGNPYSGPRAEVAVRCLGPSSAVPSPLGLRCPYTSTNAIQLAFLHLQLPCGRYKQLFCSAPAHSRREGAAWLAGEREWVVSLSSFSLLLFPGEERLSR